MLQFEWDPEKAKQNKVKHQVSFEEAATVFHDPLSFTFDDPDHSKSELRFVTFGLSEAGKYLVVAHTDRQSKIRIISAREMTRKEKASYEEY